MRAGLLTREEAFELAKKTDTERPPALDWYLQITGFSEDEFNAVMREHRAQVTAGGGLTDAAFSDAVQAYRASQVKP